MADDYNFTGSETYTPQLRDLKVRVIPKQLDMIFVVDISGSMMTEGRIGAVNEAFARMIPVLRELQMKCDSEFEMRISILAFSTQAQWLVKTTPIMEYNHQEIICTKWATFYSQAFKALGEKLTKNEFMAHTGKVAEPYIMFMTDGIPSANDAYQTEIDSLLNNGWFKLAHRFAVLIGKDAINSPSARAAVGEFVSDPKEGIINAADAEELAAEVQAKTIHTMKVATKYAVQNTDSESSNSAEGGSVFDQMNSENIFDKDLFEGMDFL